MKVARVRFCEVHELSDDERAEIQRGAVAIFLGSFEFEDTEMFARRVIFRSPDSKLTLLYAERGELIAFFTMNITRVELDGRRHAVIHASGYSHPELRGAGTYAVRRLLTHALRFKLREPFTPLCLVGEASTPAGYARMARHFPLLHPRRGVEPPRELTRLVTEVARERGFFPLEGDPWRVELGHPLRFRDPERLRRYAEGSAEDSVAFYLERNPGYLDNQWLVIYCAFDRAQLGAALRRELSRKLSRTRGRRAPAS